MSFRYAMSSPYNIIFVLCCLQPFVMGARILVIVPAYTFSHQVNFRPIFIELAKKGHQVVSVTTHPINDPTIKNYTEIDISHLYPPIQMMNFVALRWQKTWRQNIDAAWGHSYRTTEKILSYPPIRKLYDPKTKEKFDLLIAEIFFYYGIFALAHVFECPTIGISSLGLMNNMEDILGLPPMSSYPGNWEMANLTGHHLPFMQRMYNFVYRNYFVYRDLNTVFPTHDAIAKKYFGDDIPYIKDIVKNTSLILLNYHEVFHFPKLLHGKVIPLSGIYTSINDTQHVPKELKQFMDGADKGFVYVSFGNIAQSKDFSMEMKKMFIEVFSKLPYRVIWKLEEDLSLTKPSNIHMAKWLPQRAVLSHPNVKLFIYQGGLQSTEEALINAVPMVGMPIVADQDAILARMVDIGVARTLELSTMTKNDFEGAINEVLSNKSYKENALRAKHIYNERPCDNIKLGVWWIEYVIRNKGTPYHYFSPADDNWYSRYDEDVIAALAVIACIIIFLGLTILIKLFSFYHNILNKNLKTSKEKLKSK